MQISGVGTVLVNSAGLPLYTNNQDTATMSKCTGSCASVWVPLTITKGSPTGSSVSGALGVIDRSNGTRQVTLNGKPLYTFYLDSPGKVTGNGAKDSFGGVSFTWTVATQGAAAPAPSTSHSSGGGYGY
jgi:predicted lipoprotein with Yx(FWY)xxD motif